MAIKTYLISWILNRKFVNLAIKGWFGKTWLLFTFLSPVFHSDMWCSSLNTSEPSKFLQENSTDSYLSYGGGKLPSGFILQQNFQQTPNRNLLVPQPQIQYYAWGNPTQAMNNTFAHASYMGPIHGQMPYTPHPQQLLPNAVSQSYFRLKAPLWFSQSVRQFDIVIRILLNEKLAHKFSRFWKENVLKLGLNFECARFSS